MHENEQCKTLLTAIISIIEPGADVLIETEVKEVLTAILETIDLELLHINVSLII